MDADTRLHVYAPYRWRTNRKGVRWLAPAADPATAHAFKPADTPALFRWFADLPADADSYRHFADRFGDIDGPASGGRYLIGTFDEWAEQTHRMRTALEIWQAATEGGTRRLTQCMDRLRAAAATAATQAQRQTAAAAVERFAYWRGLRVGMKAPWAGVRVVAEIVSAELVGCAPTLAESDPLAAWQTAQLPDRPLQLTLAPRGLLGAVWWQCAAYLTSGAHLRQCDSCGEWFKVEPPLSRSTKRYCSDRCRMRAHRARKP